MDGALVGRVSDSEQLSLGFSDMTNDSVCIHSCVPAKLMETQHNHEDTTQGQHGSGHGLTPPPMPLSFHSQLRLTQ